MTVSGRITNKVVSPSPGPRGGDIIRFDVETKDGPRTVSQFSNKLTDEALAVLRALVVGMWADFETIENKVTKAGPNFGKVYLNIVSAVPVTQVREENVAPPHAEPPEKRRESVWHTTEYGSGHKGLPPVHPDGLAGTTREGDTKIRSMALSYAKDLALALKAEEDKLLTDGIIDLAKRFEQYILTGE